MTPIEAMNDNYMQVDSIIHIGANEGQERFVYRSTGASRCIYIEPIGQVFDILERNISGWEGHRALKALCSDRTGETITFNIASNGGESSSMLGLGDHAKFHPSIVYTRQETMSTVTLDDLLTEANIARQFNLVVIDTQGAELKVLRGATETVRNSDAFFVEVSESPLYDGGCTFAEITEYMGSMGLNLRWAQLNANGHGDAFYRRRSYLNDLPMYSGNKALGKLAEQSSRSMWSTGRESEGATNGQVTGSFGFHTDKEQNPWWKLDLGAVIPIHEIRIFNRMGMCKSRSKSIQVFLSNDGESWELIHDQDGKVFGGIDGRPLRILLKDISGRYVKLMLNDFEYLHLDEVQVY
jgi:FkbM family methyltransferase